MTDGPVKMLKGSEIGAVFVDDHYEVPIVGVTHFVGTLVVVGLVGRCELLSSVLGHEMNRLSFEHETSSRMTERWMDSLSVVSQQNGQHILDGVLGSSVVGGFDGPIDARLEVAPMLLVSPLLSLCGFSLTYRFSAVYRTLGIFSDEGTTDVVAFVTAVRHSWTSDRR
jgi:hypothetical protein